MNKMARRGGSGSNPPDSPLESIDPAALFEVLEEWEHQLSHSDLSKIKRLPNKGPKR